MLKVTVGRPPVVRMLVGAALVSSVALAQPSVPKVAKGAKWSVPVVELLVDPWANKQAAAPAGRRGWVPSQGEIVDPWADEAPPSSPRMASQHAGPPRSTIF